jgi:hypothetical protein
MRAKRFTATAIVAAAVGVLLVASGATVALGPGSARAQNGETVVTSHPHSGAGFTLEVNASLGVLNRIRLSGCLAPNRLSRCVIEDTKGVTEASSKCTQESPTEVSCSRRGLRHVNVDTRDKIDSVNARGIELRRTTCGIRLGRGSDGAQISGRCTIHGNRGFDSLTGRSGNQRLFGGRRGDNIWGGRGNNDYCNGGRGNDFAGEGCETKISIERPD